MKAPSVELPDTSARSEGSGAQGSSGLSGKRLATGQSLWLSIQHPALIALVTFAASLALYVSTRSISLDDFDSFNFARAIDRFDVSLNQPQPPGYPLYVLLARLFDLVARDHQTALTLLSACSGAVGVLAFAALAADLGAPWAALPLAVAPLWWLSSEMALSDVPGLALAMVAVFLLNRGLAGRGWLIAGGVALGLDAGVRPQAAVVPLAVLVFWVAPRLRGQPKTLAMGVAAAAAAGLVWAAPFALTFPSLTEAWRTMAGQGQYVGATDSLLTRPLTWPSLAARLAEFGSVFSAYLGGPIGGGLPAFLGLAGVLIALALLATKRARGLALAWLLPNAAFMLLAMRPDDPRKVLPVIPPMFLLLAAARPERLLPRKRVRLASGSQRGILAALSCVVAAAWLAVSSAPLVRVLATEKAPSEQAAAYIAANFSPSDTAVIAGLSYNAVRYRDPAFSTFLVDDAPAAQQAYRNLVVLDKEGFTVPENYVGADSRTFQRDPLVLPKAAAVWMAVYHPLNELPGPDLALPEEPLHVGTPEDVRYLMEGWYRPEQIAGVAARWTDSRARARFWVSQPRDANLQLVAAAYPASEQLTLSVNGQVAAQLPMAQGWAPYNISLPATLFHAEAINILTLDHSAVATAYDATDGQSLDRRPLAAAYSSLDVQWR